MGVGFYGNSETNDGVYQLTYSLYNANHTLAGVDSLVSTDIAALTLNDTFRLFFDLLINFSLDKFQLKCPNSLADFSQPNFLLSKSLTLSLFPP